MTSTQQILRGAAFVALGGLLSACTTLFGAPVPDDPGLYALQGNGKYVRLDGNAKWERKTWALRSNLRGDVRFVVVDPSLADTSQPAKVRVHLFKVGWVRSEIAANGQISPVRGSQWSAPRIPHFNVPLRFTPVEDERSAIGAVPQAGRLPPGLYSLQIDAGSRRIKGRFGVAWLSVDRKQYSSANCVDRYPGAKVGYRPCTNQALATVGKGLRLYLVKPEEKFVDGRRVLVLKGTIVNVSNRLAIVPMLEGNLHDKQGRTLYRWVFRAPVSRLKAGESVAFQATTREVPQATARAVVEFASLGLVPDNIARH